jgi:hypothetical protein
MSSQDKKVSKKDESEVFIDTLKNLLAEPHQDEAWNEKFKATVRKYFDI